MEIENCQIHGQVPQDSQYCEEEIGKKANDLKAQHCAARNWKYVSEASKRSKSGLSKNGRSTMLDNRMVLISLILTMKNSRNFQKMRGESLNFRCQNQTRRMQGSLQRSGYLQDEIRITKILHIGHETTHCRERNQLIEPLQHGAQVHSFASKAMTIPDAKAAVDGKNLKIYRHGS